MRKWWSLKINIFPHHMLLGIIMGTKLFKKLIKGVVKKYKYKWLKELVDKKGEIKFLHPLYVGELGYHKNLKGTWSLKKLMEAYERKPYGIYVIIGKNYTNPKYYDYIECVSIAPKDERRLAKEYGVPVRKVDDAIAYSYGLTGEQNISWEEVESWIKSRMPKLKP